uniref:helix-turn-helix domain-containing protein n=1 Tax=Qipengyuania sp. GPGPB31 TaxID=3023518 RepID=UPI004053F330
MALGAELKSRYEAGNSVRQIADETGYSIQRVRSLLASAETSMRPRGRRGS